MTRRRGGGGGLHEISICEVSGANLWCSRRREKDESGRPEGISGPTLAIAQTEINDFQHLDTESSTCSAGPLASVNVVPSCTVPRHPMNR